jgi:hypothetical protein
MARIKRVGPTPFKSQVISKLLERLPALQPWPKDTHGLYTKPPSGSEVKAGIWHRLEDLSTAYVLATRTDAEGDSNEFSRARDVILEYLECNFPEELEQLQNTGSINIRAIAASDDETRTKQAHFKSQVISKLLERLPALQPWPKDTHDWYTKPPSGSEVKLGIWYRLEDLSTAKDFEDARDVILEYLQCNFPEELEQLLDDGLGDSDSDDDEVTGTHLAMVKEKLLKKKYLIQEVGRKFPGIFGNRGLGDADPVNLLANRIMNEGRERPLEWIFSEIERALPDARKVAGAMYRNIELEQEIKKVEEECKFWREATLKLSKEVPAVDDGGYVPEIRFAFEELPLPIRDGHVYEIKEQTAKLEQEIKKVEEECNFWREATLKLSKEVPADDETMARLGWTIEYK